MSKRSKSRERGWLTAIGIFIFGMCIGEFTMLAISLPTVSTTTVSSTTTIWHSIPTTSTIAETINWTATAKCVDNIYENNLTYSDSMAGNASDYGGWLNFSNASRPIQWEATGKYAYECGSQLYNFTDSTNAKRWGTLGIGGTPGYAANYMATNEIDIAWVHFWTQYCTTIWACAYLNRNG